MQYFKRDKTSKPKLAMFSSKQSTLLQIQNNEKEIRLVNDDSVGSRFQLNLIYPRYFLSLLNNQIQKIIYFAIISVRLVNRIFAFPFE